MGLRRIEDKLAKEAALREQGADYAMKELEDMIDNLKDLHNQLKQIEKKYGDKLKNPVISAKLMNIREELGLPTAIGAFKPKSKPGLVDKLSGGGFFEQLALQILEIGQESIPKTGGTLSYADLVKKIQERYSGYVISLEEMGKAITILLKHDLLIRVEKIGGIKILVFAESDSPDLETIMKIAIKNKGQLSRERILIETGWKLNRINRALESLEEKELLEKIDSVEGIQYYFPGV
ncbi:MAG: hypothetical protein HeimC3_03180 [Candidatus Heimdallarchaeota archaeon LC_3]|uniref:Putative EAP30 domain-containing protein n=1 Tax=uncultured organism TaxID=155900 RepID=A0A0F6PYL1_9ZZZZ|nr:putative EAP30 domain-containing protein [uncultured organism]OLS27539.1 MAG: hypothetical protein HeimC3_03180 [Candidatus Heimdallarchaeota archaeon LC_3]